MNYLPLSKKKPCTTQDLRYIRRQGTKYIDETETYDAQVGEQTTFHQLYRDMMTAFLAYVTYLQIKYRAV